MSQNHLPELAAETVKDLELHVGQRRPGQCRSDGLDESNDVFGARVTFVVELLPPKILRSGEGISASRAFLEVSPKLGERVVPHGSSDRRRRRARHDEPSLTSW